MSTTTVRISDPVDLIHFVDTRMNLRVTDSLVLIWIGAEGIPIVRIDLPAHAADATNVIEACVRPLKARVGECRVLLITYTDDTDLHDALRDALAKHSTVAHHLRLDTTDRLHVGGVEVAVVDRAERSGDGEVIATSRDEIRNSLTPGGDEALLALMPALAGSMPLAALVEGDGPWPDHARGPLAQVASQLSEEREELLALIRDNPKRMADRLTRLAPHLVPEESAGHMLALTAMALYLAGDGLRANVALDIARDLAPDNCLTQTMTHAAAMAIPPSELREAMREPAPTK